jgi:deazaflavin-dependent oxidoreductase (nitroreductase family)
MWFNPIMIWLIKSPLHFFVSKNMMLITYTGRKSGKSYTIPVNYLQDGETLYTTSWRERTWWRNLREGKTVNLRLRGKDLEATPEVFETDEGVASLLTPYFQIAPNMTRYFEVGLDSEGNPLPEDIVTAAKTRIMVQLKIL